MDNRIASPDSRWDNYCKKIIVLINNNGDDFPAEDEINKLVRHTERAFTGTPFLQHAMDRAFKIRRDWKLQDNKREKLEKIKEMPPMEEKKELDDVTKAAIKNVITKIAIENNIKMADKVTVRLSPVDGTISFEGIE